MSEENSASQGEGTKLPSSGEKSSAKGGCLRRLGLGALVIIPILAVLINGPIFRWIADYGIQKGAASQGLVGKATVRGTIVGGFEVAEMEFFGDKGDLIEKLSIGNVGVKYSLAELVQTGGLTWLNEVNLSDAEIAITLKDKSETEEEAEEEEADESPEGTEPSILWQLLETHYHLNNLDVTIVQGEKVYEIEGFSLNVGIGGEGELSIARLVIPGAKPREGIKTPVNVTPSSLALGPLAVLDGVEISALTLLKASADEPLVTAALGLSGGVVDVSYSRNGAINASLSDGAVSLPELLSLGKIDGMKSGSITELDVQFSGDFGVPATWDSDISLALSTLQWGSAKIGEVSMSAILEPGDGKDEELNLNQRSGEATLEASALVGLADTLTPADLASLPLNIEANLNVPAVEDLVADYLPEETEKVPVTGTVTGDLSVEIANRKLVKTRAKLLSSTLAYDGVPIEALTVDAQLQELDQLTADAALTLDDNTSVRLDGSLDLAKLAYAATAEIKASVQGRLKTLLQSLDFDKELEGATTVFWKGEGSLKEKEHRGSASVEATGVRIDGAASIAARVEGSYQGINITLPVVSVKSEQLQIDGSLNYLDSVLELPQFGLRSGELELLKGRVKTPLDPAVFKAPVEFFAQTGALDIDIQSSELPLKSILGLIQKEVPVDCMLGLSLKASGSPADLTLDGALKAGNIILTDKSEVPPADVALNLAVISRNARIDGSFKHPQIKPFNIEATMPFVPAAWIDGTRDPMTESISASATMEESQLAFVRSYVPSIEGLDGSIDVDVSLKGTLDKPEFQGTSDLRIDGLRFVSPSAPSIRDAAVSLSFDKNAISVRKLDAIVAGGRVGMLGDVTFLPGESPEFDLRLGGHEVLAYRTDSLSIRTDADISLKGPFNAALVEGTVGITNSLFYKDVDLLPIGGPGKGGGKSEVPEVDPGPKVPLPKSINVGVPLEPFNNWNVDLRLVTLEPFRVAGNLAQADVLCDVAVRGRLEAPVPDGRIWVENGRLTLPFSKVELTEAAVRFDESTGFNGAIALRAGSKVGDSQVSIYSHGRVLAPKLLLTSIPPLPREDILTLLASGVTREQLADGGGTAATKAAIYYLKSLRNKEGKIDPNAPPSFAETLEERTDVAIGKVDPDTGEMGVDASIRLWRQSYAAFSLGMKGSYRGVLKYIFRFR